MKGTRRKGLIYSKTTDPLEIIVGHVDSDYATNLDGRRSLTGYVFSLFGNVIGWRSILVVALSSIEFEYIALFRWVKERIWLKDLTSEMYDGKCEVKIFCENQTALALSRNQTFLDRTKHIDVRFHFIRDAVIEWKFSL